MKQQSLKSGEYFLLCGPATIKIASGAVEIIAARIEAGETLQVPLGKKVPVKALEDSSVEFDVAQDGFTKMEVSSIPEEWDRLAARILGEVKEGSLYSIMVLGEVDTGKTFFSTYLANRLVGSKKRTAILDCDAGQSDIGPPGTFGMLVMKKPVVFLTEEQPTHMYMLGAHAPGLHFIPTLTGLHYMTGKAQQDSDILIIDTTGWVQGDGGRAIKKAKLDMMNPDMVILMQRGKELEHLVKHLPATRIVRLPVSKKASPTSQQERKSLRENVSVKYFKNAKVLEIPFKQVFTDRCYFLTGETLSLDGTFHAERLSGWEGTLVVTSGPLIPEITKSWPNDLGRITNFISGEEKGLMVALLSEDQETLAIGRLDGIDFLNNLFRIRTPWTGKQDKIKGIQFGSLKLNEKGEEAGFLEPGTF